MNILLGICGGIAAYKTPDLVRKLVRDGHQVQVVLTAAGGQFVAPLALQTVSGHPVRSDLFDAEAESAMDHIELARWADTVLIAPATAHCIAQLANGLAGDLLTTLCLATTAPLVLAPAMNVQMWQHPATRDNVQRLLQRGAEILGPAQGEQACGETGPGRMLEPTEIAQALSPARTC